MLNKTNQSINQQCLNEVFKKSIMWINCSGEASSSGMSLSSAKVGEENLLFLKLLLLAIDLWQVSRTAPLIRTALWEPWMGSLTGTMWVFCLAIHLVEVDIQANVTNYTLSTAVLYNLKRIQQNLEREKTVHNFTKILLLVDFAQIPLKNVFRCPSGWTSRGWGHRRCWSFTWRRCSVRLVLIHLVVHFYQHINLFVFIEEENVEMSGLQEGMSQIHIPHLDRKLSNHGGRNTIIYFNLENPFYHPLPSGFSYNHFRVNLTMTYKVQDTCC